MLAGLALVALSEVVMLRVASEAGALAREDLAFALSVVLLGMLMMVVRRNAVSMVVGFMSLENGLILAATGAKGMPLVVEVSVAFSVLVALVVIGVFLFRIAERFETVDAHALDRFRGAGISRSSPVLPRPLTRQGSSADPPFPLRAIRKRHTAKVAVRPA
jgi:hydrogenase-4 component E